MNKLINGACLLLVILLLAGCQNKDEGNNVVNVTKPVKQIEPPVSASLRTEDDQVIKATFYPNNASGKGIILIHQFAKDKTSWFQWAPVFQKTHNVLAIDLRGHGESTGDIKKFKDEDFNKMQLDVKAAKEFLERKEIKEELISYIGASIGANTVQNFVSNTSFDRAILLSPGENYKGIQLTMKDNGVLAIASEEDSYSFQSVKKLEQISPNSKFIYLVNRGHGTNMLDEAIISEITDYLK